MVTKYQIEISIKVKLVIPVNARHKARLAPRETLYDDIPPASNLM